MLGFGLTSSHEVCQPTCYSSGSAQIAVRTVQWVGWVERFVRDPTPPIGYGFTEWWIWSGWRGRDSAEVLLERIGADRSTHGTG